MNEGKPSRTSEGTTATRAAEMRRPEGERICHDPLARHEEIEPFLRERGFGRIEIMSPTASKKAWFHGVNKDIHISEMFRFVHAIHF